MRSIVTTTVRNVLAADDVFPLTEKEKLFCLKMGTYTDNGMWPEPWRVWREVFDDADDGAYTKNKDSCTNEARILLQKQNVQDCVQNYRETASKRLHEEVTQYGIAIIANRVRRKNRDWLRIEQIKEARAGASARINARIEKVEADLLTAIENDHDPDLVADLQRRLDLLTRSLLVGTETGLMVVDVKIIGSGEDSERIEYAKFDKAILDAQLELENSVAEELGQKRLGPTVNVQKAYIGFDPEAV